MRKLVALALTLVLILGIVQVASARPLYFKKAPFGLGPYGSDIGKTPFWGQNLIKYLNLTDEQINKIKEVRDKYYKKLKELWSRLQDAVFSLRQLQFEKQPDKAQIDKTKDEIDNLRKEISKTMDEYWKEIKEILTKEQLAKLTPPYRVRRAPWGPCPFYRW
jgi:Spy/CpxP family protein refolding chaperone